MLAGEVGVLYPHGNAVEGTHGGVYDGEGQEDI
jgi:hypothetical protein